MVKMVVIKASEVQKDPRMSFFLNVQRDILNFNSVSVCSFEFIYLLFFFIRVLYIFTNLNIFNLRSLSTFVMDRKPSFVLKPKKKQYTIHMKTLRHRFQPIEK